MSGDCWKASFSKFIPIAIRDWASNCGCARNELEMLPECQRRPLVLWSGRSAVHIHGVSQPVLWGHRCLPALRHRLVHDVCVHRCRQLLLGWSAPHLTAAGHLWHVGGHGHDGKIHEVGISGHPKRLFLERNRLGRSGSTTELNASQGGIALRGRGPKNCDDNGTQVMCSRRCDLGIQDVS